MFLFKVDKFQIKFLLLIFGLTIGISSCKKPEDTKVGDFDRNAFLNHYGKNLIRPSYQKLNGSLNILQANISLLLDNPNEIDLEGAQTAWISAYLDFQDANAFNFGPAEASGLNKSLVEEIGTFPVNTSQIETFISQNDTSFQNFNRDTRGFLAIEYLLFGASNEDIVNALQNTNRKNYLAALTNNLCNRVGEVNTAWASYLSDFVSNNGVDAGSSTSALYNEFVKSFEAIKNFKLGIPLGLRPGQISTEPNNVEALYSEISVLTLKKNYETIKNIYFGIGSDGTTGPSFKDYLLSVSGGQELVTATEQSLKRIDQAMTAVNSDPLNLQITNNYQALEDLHTEMQKHTRFFKSDMSSLLGISITFSSGDGD